jgi:DNA excision repair protein ERCC-5
MGVTGLWSVVAPTARPTQLATLNRKRLAVDASIWIYQFLKAVRDKEGNALRNSHVVGFFRRICKLLYFGIKPVFVFDGGAPSLKRETVRGRARRREGRREDAARTAGKLLGIQMQKAAEEGEKRRRVERQRVRTPEPEQELPPEEDMVYVDEIGMSNKERQQNRQFKRKDQYHLPDLDISIESMGAPNDPRIMSQAELEEYARHFHSGEDINLYDFSKIDFESPFFLSLPASDRYNILNAARLRSRLRMGYSKEQLDDMFPDRMAFSRFQIERVRERNELTQRLMHVNGMAEDFLDQGGRIAGEKGKEYILVKNEGVEGGWALGVVSSKGNDEADAIDLDEEAKEESDLEEYEEEDFEDVAIEGLNRLPRRWARNRKEVDYNPDYKDAAEEIAQKRRAVYEARHKDAVGHPSLRQQETQPESDELFVREDHQRRSEDERDELFEDVDLDQQQDQQDELQRAIQMSLQKQDNDDVTGIDEPGVDSSTTENRRRGRNVAKSANDRAIRLMNDHKSLHPDEDDEQGDFDLQAALAESRKSKHQLKSHARLRTSIATVDNGKNKFNGPLPFQSLNLGQSLLGKMKADKIEQDQAGGFEKETEQSRTKTAPLPSWFAVKDWTKKVEPGDANEGNEHGNANHDPEEVDGDEPLILREADNIIDVDQLSKPRSPEQIVIDLSEDAVHMPENLNEHKKIPEWNGMNPELEVKDANDDESMTTHEAVRGTKSDGLPMDDVAYIVRVNPPESTAPEFLPKPPAEAEGSISAILDIDDHVDWSDTDEEGVQRVKQTLTERQHGSQGTTVASKGDIDSLNVTGPVEEAEDEFEDVEVPPLSRPPAMLRQETSILNDTDVAMANEYLVANNEEDTEENVSDRLRPGLNASAVQEDDFSDSDEELMRQMAIEAEEHARFASSLHNARTPADAARDYDKELKQLRNQQKKDRRDADEVTQVMVQECQALLRLFGLPYITAPMEAEAQCAELVSLGLVDGIVTDDSDIFLFGGTRVYKNMFNAAKFVECYLTTDLEKEYALDRSKLIRFAHLLGSDYTEGIPGVGPVSALEILTEFDTLEEFRDWCAQIQTGQFDGNITTPFRKKFRKQAQKMFLPPAFPDARVDHAYLHPDVDTDPSGFEWGVPDLDALRAFLMATIGWSQERTDEVLVPVVRDMNKRGVEGTQANITRFFGGGVGVGGREAAAPRNRGSRSGRMENAFGRLKRVAEKKRHESDRAEAVNVVDQRGDNVNADMSRTNRQKRRVAGNQSAAKTITSNVKRDGNPSNDEDSDLSVEKAPTKRRKNTKT